MDSQGIKNGWSIEEDILTFIPKKQHVEFVTPVAGLLLRIWTLKLEAFICIVTAEDRPETGLRWRGWHATMVRIQELNPSHCSKYSELSLTVSTTWATKAPHHLIFSKTPPGATEDLIRLYPCGWVLLNELMMSEVNFMYKMQCSFKMLILKSLSFSTVNTWLKVLCFCK